MRHVSSRSCVATLRTAIHLLLTYLLTYLLTLDIHQLINQHLNKQGPGLQNILRQSYDYLTIIPTYDGRLIYKNILRRAQGFS